MGLTGSKPRVPSAPSKKQGIDERIYIGLDQFILFLVPEGYASCSTPLMTRPRALVIKLDRAPPRKTPREEIN